jgi:hypothetical protein
LESVDVSNTLASMTSLGPTTPRNRVSAAPATSGQPVITRVSWRATESMDYSAWAREGGRIGALARGSAWWLGDWLYFGTAKWGDRYAKAARITGYDAKTLRNMRYVASKFPTSLRRDNLTWSHHALVAGHTPEEQDYWLDRATRDSFSVEDLRAELRRAKRQLEAASAPAERNVIVSAHKDRDNEGPPENAVRCPQCGCQLDAELAP